MRNLFTTTALAIFLAGCGGSGSEPATPSSTEATPEVVSTPEAEPTPEAQSTDVAVAEEAEPDAPETEAPTVTAQADGDAEIAALMAALPAPYSEADYKSGQRVFKQCATCHRLDPKDGHRVGPNLHGFFGREAGSLDDFKYSKALAEADFTWTPEQMEAWLAGPKKFLPGNRMSFAGVPRESQRHDVIAYLLIESSR